MLKSGNAELLKYTFLYFIIYLFFFFFFWDFLDFFFFFFFCFLKWYLRTWYIYALPVFFLYWTTGLQTGKLQFKVTLLFLLSSVSFSYLLLYKILPKYSNYCLGNLTSNFRCPSILDNAIFYCLNYTYTYLHSKVKSNPVE